MLSCMLCGCAGMSVIIHYSLYCILYFIAYYSSFTAPRMTHMTMHAFSFPPTIFPTHSHLTCPFPYWYICHHALYVTTTDEDPRLRSKGLVIIDT